MKPTPCRNRDRMSHAKNGECNVARAVLFARVSDFSMMTWRGKQREIPLALARLTFLALLAVAPWVQGSAPVWAVALMTPWLLWVVGLYALSWILAGPRWTSGWAAPALGAGALAYGWAMTLHPMPSHDPVFQIYDPVLQNMQPLDPISSWGTIEPGISTQVMLRLTGLFLALLIASDLSAQRGWSRALIVTMAGNGALVSVYGLIQKADGDVLHIWQGKPLSPAVFGVYWYHANAAAFLELCWPLAGALMWQAFRNRWSGKQGAQALWVLATLGMAAGFMVNISKVGHVLFVIEGICMLAGLLWIWRKGDDTAAAEWGSGQNRVWLFVILFAGAVVGMATAFGLEGAWRRWPELFAGRGESLEGRRAMARYCWAMLPQAGWLGDGPGTFDMAFTTSALDGLPKPRGHWRFAHDDYLQYALEWGAVGGAMLLALAGTAVWMILGGMKRLLQTHAMNRAAVQWAMIVALGAVALHATVDFPLQILSLQLYFVCLLGAATNK